MCLVRAIPGTGGTAASMIGKVFVSINPVFSKGESTCKHKIAGGHRSFEEIRHGEVRCKEPGCHFLGLGKTFEHSLELREPAEDI